MEKTLGIYARQSREKETTGSIDDQILQGQKKAVELSMIPKIYTDRGQSAAYDTLDNRPQFLQLLSDVESGLIDAIYVYDESRLTRNQDTRHEIKKVLIKHNILVHTTLDSIINYSDQYHEMFSYFRTFGAAKTVRDGSLKNRSVLRNRAAEGKAHTGILKPYGYTGDAKQMLIVEEEEAVVIKEMFKLAQQGFGSSKIANILNEREIPTKGRKLLKNGIQLKTKHIPNEKLNWAAGTVLAILKGTIYKGERHYKGEIFPAPAIIDSDTWEEVQQQILKNTNAPGLNKYNYLLKNLCVCGRCKRDFCGRTRPDQKDHVYYCASKREKNKQDRCGIRSLNITYLEDMVWFMVCNSSLIPELAMEEVNNLQNPDYIIEIKQEKKRLEAKLKQEEQNKIFTFNMLKKGLLTEEEAEKEMGNNLIVMQNLKNQISEINIKLNNSNAVIEKINYSQEFLKAYSGISATTDFKLKYEMIRLFVDKIIINYSEIEEKYTVEVEVKFPETKELHTFILNKKGEPTIFYDNEPTDPFCFSNINYLSKVTTLNGKKSTETEAEQAVLPNYFNALHSHPQKEQRNRCCFGWRWNQPAAGRDFAGT